MEKRRTTILKQNLAHSHNSVALTNPLPVTVKPHKFYVHACGYEEEAASYFSDSIRFNYYMLNYTVAGKGQLTYNNVKYTLAPGDLVLINSYNHRILRPLSDKDYDWKIFFMHIVGDDIKDFFSESQQDNILILRDFPMENIRDSVMSILDRLKNLDDRSENAISAVIHRLLLDIRDHSEANARTAIPGLMAVLDYIHSNYIYPINLDDITAHAFISKSHLNVLFEQMGISPMQYVLQLRLKKAQELMCTTSMSEKQIAIECGFDCHRNMLYAFKRHLEQTPSSYRAHMRKLNVLENSDKN